jgi:hypothetical protein
MKITIPVSVGELLDKISILQIKSQYTDNSFVYKELEDLSKVAQENKVYTQDDINSLLEVNQKLWDIEDKLRLFEKKHLFDEDFVQLARLVYTYNDQRADIKKNINQKYGSEYQEVKCYV